MRKTAGHRALRHCCGRTAILLAALVAAYLAIAHFLAPPGLIRSSIRLGALNSLPGSLRQSDRFGDFLSQDLAVARLNHYNDGKPDGLYVVELRSRRVRHVCSPASLEGGWVLRGPGSFSVSADGRHVIWCDYRERHVCVADIATGSMQTWSLPGAGYAAWNEDGRRWMALTHDPNDGFSHYSRLVTGSCGRVGFESSMPVPAASLLAGHRYRGYYRMLDPFAWRSDGSFVISVPGEGGICRPGPTFGDAPITIYSGGNLAVPRSRSRLAVRVAKDVQDVQFSPSQRRIAWLTIRTFEPPLPYWLSSLPVLSRWLTRHSLSLYVSDDTGANVRELGREAIGQEPTRDQWLCWSVDGRYIFFGMNDALYAIPAGADPR
jgi:hypothetical protein